MRKTSIHWVLLGALALMPTAVLAQETAQPKTDVTLKLTEKSRAKAPAAKKEEPKKEEPK